jgi:hypothetical protein
MIYNDFSTFNRKGVPFHPNFSKQRQLSELAAQKLMVQYARSRHYKVLFSKRNGSQKPGEIGKNQKERKLGKRTKKERGSVEH